MQTFVDIKIPKVFTPYLLLQRNAYMEVGKYDSREGIGRVESGAETESNAWSNCRGENRM